MSWATTSCGEKIPIYFFKAELKSGFQSNSVGGGFDNVPFYSTITGQQLGNYTDEATNYKSGDCAGTGAFSFGSFKNPYPSQIVFTFTCFGLYNTITGGNGNFGCASGYESFVYENDTVIESAIHLCGTLCPVVNTTGGW